MNNSDFTSLKVVALAGGVGGARLADGLYRALPPGNLTVIVNTGDDFSHYGLYISPDLDTVIYTLAGLSSPETGWGRQDESWRALEIAAGLGGPTWFRLGDRDLGLHLERTRCLAEGEPLSAFTRRVCAAWGVTAAVLPMSDDPTPTLVETAAGQLAFQDYFVRLRCEPVVTGFTFAGIESAQPAPGVLAALAAADLVVICPSNPWVSVAPILALPGVRALLASRKVLAVSPLIAGQAVKGPAAKMYRELGIPPTALSVARHYGSLLGGFVLDLLDQELQPAVESLGMHCLPTQTLMRTPADRLALARTLLAFGMQLNA